VLDSALHSPQGHLLYRLGSWPFEPLTVGAAVVLVLAAAREGVCLWLADSWLLRSSGSSETGSTNGVLRAVSDVTGPIDWPGQLALASVAAYAQGSLIKVDPQQLRGFGSRARDVLRDIPGLADRLPDPSRGRFDDYHRLLAEATLRLNVAVPLALLLSWPHGD